jgi:hypothetical protein
VITIDFDHAYAPCCYIICRVNEVDGSYSTRDEESTILICTDWEWPQVAEWFGWRMPKDMGPEEAIPLAGAYLDKNLGKCAEDPGYFL